MFPFLTWSERLDLNQQPHDPKSRALPIGLRPDLMLSVLLVTQLILYNSFLVKFLYTSYSLEDI